MSLLLLASLAGTGCANSEDAAPSAVAEVSGAVDGITVVPLEPFAAQYPNGHRLAPRDLAMVRMHLYEGSVLNFCPDVATPTDQPGLEISILADTIAVGTYALREPFSDTASFEARFYDGSGSALGEPATGGTVVLDEVGPTVSGTFVIEFGEESLTGSFTMPVACQAT